MTADDMKELVERMRQEAGNVPFVWDPTMY